MVMHHQGAAISVGGEGRITPFGAKLRRYKLDELPQLWNVLIGDMSLVGPRPDVPSEIEKLTLEQKRILDVRPGITSPASLKYRNEERILQGKEDPLRYYDEVVLPDKIRMNLDYVDNWSLWKDVVCIVKTVL
jgi:sugar transferase